MKRRKKKEMGFSLIELLDRHGHYGPSGRPGGSPVCLGKWVNQSRTQRVPRWPFFETALDTYRLDVGKYPSAEQGLQALRTKPSDEEKWDGPYLPKSVPKDPWGHPYVYSRTDNGEVKMISLGADGTEGGEGEDKDISSREGEEEDSG